MRGVETTAGAADGRERAGAADTIRLFAVMWAMAALFHVWTDARSADLLHDPSWTGAVHVGVVVAALAVLLRPGSVRGLAVLAAFQVASVAFELPHLGNHWLLAGLVALALLLALGLRRERWDAAFLPTARITVLVAYAFAAFSKLNDGFFTTATSCATFYADETVTAFGLPGLPDGGPLAWTLVIGTVAVECSVPALLLWRPTRHAGVVLALLFHSAIALDIKHLFTDFSSVLLALFVLFLPGSFATWTREQVRARGYRPLLPVVALALISLVLWTTPGRGPGETSPLVGGLGWLVWLGFDAAVLVGVLAYLRTRPRPADRPLRGAPWPLLLVPALVAVNGLTPYLEVKTAFGWNMYSNLATVDGRSNHLLVPRTAHLSDQQRSLVTVIDSSDPELREYATDRYRLTVRSLRLYAAEHPDVRLRYELDGRVRDVRLGDDPMLSRPVPLPEAKLGLFRAVDADSPKRCQDTWGVAH